MSLKFDNRFVRELPGESEENNRPRQVMGACWSPVTPTPVSAPRLLAYSREMVDALGLSSEEMESQEWLSAMAGNSLVPGMHSYSMCYGGHQFGGWAGQLGDGRAINLGEVIGANAKRWVLQLKGAGPTPYSRRADGRAVLRSSIREFICSEAMFHLGVPTTRALSLVWTGDDVVRDMFYDGRPAPEPGAIVCRVSPSFVRFGNFEIFASRGDTETLNKLLDFVLSRDYPEMEGQGDEKLVNFFNEVCERTAKMVAEWMRVGYVHGVMNTDNMSVFGLTIDYGPYGWIDNYDPNWTPNTTDLPGRRYRFSHQPMVAQWNLLQLANAVAMVMVDPQRLREGLERYAQVYESTSMAHSYAKFGLTGNPEDETLMAQGYQLLQESELDMTLFFRLLATYSQGSGLAHFDGAVYDPEKVNSQKEAWEAWLQVYLDRVESQDSSAHERAAQMNAVNPLYVPRNYLLQEAIDLAEAGDESRITMLMELFREPYQEKVGMDEFSKRRPDWAKNKPGCSALSCSS